MRFSLRRDQAPPPPAARANGEDGYESMLTDEESSYGPMPPPPPPPPPSSDIVALQQVAYDEENAEFLEKSTKNDPPEQPNETQDMTQEDEDEDEDDDETNDGDEPEEVQKEEEHDLRNLPHDDDDGEDDTEIPAYDDDDDAESVEIPPTSVVQRMIAQESFNHEKKVMSSTLCRAGTIMTCCLLLLAIILGVGLGTGAFTQDSGTNNGNSADRDNGDSDPTRAADIQLYLSSISVVPGNIQATDTAESKAVSWLIAEDPLSLGIESVEDQFRIGQRYALLAFYFGSSKKWINETGWLVLEDECEWHGVTCQEETISSNSSTVNAVTALVLSSNAVNTKIPPDFVLLQSLATLDVSDNVMEQDLSSFIWKSMVGMEVLRLDSNNFTGDVSIFMELPVTLQVLSIGANGFTGTIPGSLDVFQALTEVNFEKNQLSGSISDVFTDLNVTTLRIGENNFDANSFPVFIYTMTQLEVLGLGKVNINSEIEPALESLQKLRVLELYGNPLNGSLPDVLLSMTSLEEIVAYECQFSGPFPDISTLINIKVLQLHDNEFTGTITDTLSTLTSIRTLSLEGNRLTGNIPVTITALQTLEVLDLSKNHMSGELPVDIGGLFSLRELKLNSQIHPDFAVAGLMGTIPTSIGNLARLEILELRGNFLNGQLPDTLGGLDAIRIFDVQYNRFTGQVPEAIGEWSDTIMSMAFSNNEFTGSIPSSICSDQIVVLAADCTVTCTCCTECV